jgi:hypothetical protein
VNNIIKKITKYGVLSIEAIETYFKIGCRFSLPAREKEKFVSVTDENITRGIFRLSKTIEDEYTRVADKIEQNSESFNYGTTSNFKKIVY